MRVFPHLSLIFILSCSFEVASGQAPLNLTGEWHGSVTVKDVTGVHQENDVDIITLQASASITQTSTTFAVTLVFVGPNVSEMHTGTGQINGSTITFKGLVNVTGNITPNGLQFTGTGKDPDDQEQWNGSLTSDGQHMSGSAQGSSSGSHIDWSLDRTNALTILTTSLPNGTISESYSQTLTANGGTPPYMWSIVSGILPDGLALDSSTGTIDGLPTKAGTFNFTVRVTDSKGSSATGSVSIKIVASCPASVSVVPGGNNSADGLPTAMIAEFLPLTADGQRTSLSAAANACGFIGFDWQQTIDNWPPPNDSVKCFLEPLTCLTASDGSILKAPPPFLDPPDGGYLYFLVDPAANQAYLHAFPFYYNPAIVHTGCAEFINGSCNTLITSENGSVLNFFDSPNDPVLPAGAFMGFTTRLVGILPGNKVSPVLFRWSWISTYNGKTGVVQTASSQPVDGQGTGGVTLTSINGIPQTPPGVSCSATPSTIWPPNGKSVLVTVTGKVTPGTSALATTTYAVRDEYGQIRPSGSIALDPEGSYSVGVLLVGKRDGNDLDGRTYTIRVKGRDTLGNVGVCPVIVTVPHDQR